MNYFSILDCPKEQLFDEVIQATRDYEFESFVLGIERQGNYCREQQESAFRALKIWLGIKLCEKWVGRDVDFETPQMRIDLCTSQGGLKIKLHSNPLFLGGRYRKLSREIPACRWMHLKCKGQGCHVCNFTGNVCGPSIQELAEPAILAGSGGEVTLFHGAGREDVDVRMLGDGRPFVLEVRQPKHRIIDIETIMRQVNQVAEGFAEIHKLAFTEREAMIQAKSAAADKTYRAHIRFESEISGDLKTQFASMSGLNIEQLSPTRVMKRRGRDTMRRKKVIHSSLIGVQEGNYIWEVRAASGTYIKELVNGDDHRTQPSVASIFGTPCECVVLDVMEIHWIPPWEKV